MELECGHTFHQNCIVVWLNRYSGCPVCKSIPAPAAKVYCRSCGKWRAERYFMRGLKVWWAERVCRTCHSTRFGKRGPE